jgi:hypothetical protein
VTVLLGSTGTSTNSTVLSLLVAAGDDDWEVGSGNSGGTRAMAGDRVTVWSLFVYGSRHNNTSSSYVELYSVKCGLIDVNQ